VGGAVAFAFEVAVGDAGDGVEEAGEFVRVLGEDGAEGGRFEVEEDFAELDGGEVEGGGVEARAVGVGSGEGSGEFVAGVEAMEAVLLTEPIFESAEAPVAEVLGV
jgi:hypothetical protein